MKKTREAEIIRCLVLVGALRCWILLVIIAFIGVDYVNRHMLKARQEEIMAGYPDEIEAYLEEKYRRDFCVAPEWEGGSGGSPVPFAPYEGNGSRTYLAWENEEDGYAFRTNVCPESLDDRRIREIRDNYCWKFISQKIKEELETRLEGIIDDCTIVAYSPYYNMLFGENTNKDSEIKEALLDSNGIHVCIWVFVSPEIQFDESISLSKIEKIVDGFYHDCFPTNSYLDFRIVETYTGEDYLKIEPEKTEQYCMYVKESEYEDEARVPVDYKILVDISIIRGKRE